MEGLDFSALTDDQLLQLLRAAAREAAERSTGLAAAAEDIGISELERAKIFAAGMTIEIGAIRAEERRIQSETARLLTRQAYERRRQSEIAAAAAAHAEAAEQSAAAQRDREMTALRGIAAAVQMPPSKISIVRFAGRAGEYLVVNEGNDRYRSDHLAEFNLSTGFVRVARRLMPARDELAPLLRQIAQDMPPRSMLSGSSYQW